MALVGNLRDLKLPNLIQINCLEKNQAKMTIEYRRQYGTLYFADGQIVHAEFQDKVGEEAVYSLLTLKEGMFKVESDIVAPTISIRNSWSNLLLEGMRQIDESGVNKNQAAEDAIDALVAVRGIQGAMVFAANGTAIATSPDFHADKLPLFVYASYKQGKIESAFGSNGLKGILFTFNERYYLCRLGDKFLVMQFEAKVQADFVLSQVQNVIRQWSGRV
jgi:hypothetical protein